jgi:hypothetical protein
VIIWILFLACLVATILLIVTDKESDGPMLLEREIATTISLSLTIIFLIIGIVT